MGEEDQVEETVDIFDPRAQKAFDMEILVNAAKQIRSQLAVSKVNKELAQAGMLDPEAPKMHPEQFKKEIQHHLDGLALIKRLWDELGDEGLPVRFLETYVAVPPEGLTPKVTIA